MSSLIHRLPPSSLHFYPSVCPTSSIFPMFPSPDHPDYSISNSVWDNWIRLASTRAPDYLLNTGFTFFTWLWIEIKLQIYSSSSRNCGNNWQTQINELKCCGVTLTCVQSHLSIHQVGFWKCFFLLSLMFRRTWQIFGGMRNQNSQTLGARLAHLNIKSYFHTFLNQWSCFVSK